MKYFIKCKILILIFIYIVLRLTVLFSLQFKKITKNNNINSYYSIKNNIINNFTTSNISSFNSITNNFYFIIFNQIKFYFTDIKYFFSLNYNLVEFEYNIHFYYKNNTAIIPSDLTLFSDLHVMCYMKKTNSNIIINSLPNIYKYHFNCKYYFNVKEKILFGINIYNNNYDVLTSNLFLNNNINYNDLNRIIDKKFDLLFINEEFIKLEKEIKNININQNKNQLLLKKSFIDNPINYWKLNEIIKMNDWVFKNLFNNYFCFCIGSNCSYNFIPQKCKYKFYLYIIDNNREIFNKTNYLFADFLFSSKSSDDAYPIFQKMIEQNLKVHYMTQKKNIYTKYCGDKKQCIIIISDIIINGNFLEKYLNLILRLKAVITNSEFLSIDNLFYNIEYITFITLTHGVNFFKHSIYSYYYTFTRFNKLLIPPSNKLISIAKKYGWKDDNMIKICPPKWDKYDIYNKNIKNTNYMHSNNSIFIFFTWRIIKSEKKLSPYYFKNIINLLNQDSFIKAIQEYNITLYFALHHMFERYKNIFNINIKKLNFIRQDQISECLTISNLLITDFSSVVFDMIYQKKPIIIYIPDIDDPNLKDNYENGYYQMINELKKGIIYFENKFSNINDTINKIIFYLKNDFQLESNLKKFYESFELNCSNNNQLFINYLTNIN